MRVGDHPVTVVARPNTVLEDLCFLRQGHRPQLDVRNSGASANPNAVILVRQQLLNDIVRQVTLAGQILTSIAFGRREVHAHETLRRSEPNRAIGCSRNCRHAAHRQRDRVGTQAERNSRIAEAVKRTEFLRIRP